MMRDRESISIGMPRFEVLGDRSILLIDDLPALCLGGELHNSSASSRKYLASVWERVSASGVRTIIAPIAWNEMEPTEGTYDFSMLDALLSSARNSEQRLILIWFGAFKNATSVYAPTWVRADEVRFPRAALGGRRFDLPFTYKGAMSRPVLSPFTAELREADARAYAAMMSRLRAEDPDYTAVMVQVENEVGLLGSARDHSSPAEQQWRAPIPGELRRAVEEDPSIVRDEIARLIFTSAPDASWEAVFGDSTDADETFMAWAFATYVEAVASAGARVHPLPAFTNAWLGPQPGQPTPGTYPSGGPTAGMVCLWRALAPSLAFVAPDIYVQEAETAMSAYAVPGNPLFVPEARFRAGDAALAIGRYCATGYHVFGLEDGRDDSQYFELCRAMLAFEQDIIAAQTERRIIGFALAHGVDHYTAQVLDLTITVNDAVSRYREMLLDVGVDIPTASPLPAATHRTARGETPADERPFGVVVVRGDNELIVIGQRFMIDVSKAGHTTEIDEARELIIGPHGWEDGRLLNGDERLLLTSTDAVSVVRLRLLHRPHSTRIDQAES